MRSIDAGGKRYSVAEPTPIGVYLRRHWWDPLVYAVLMPLLLLTIPTIVLYGFLQRFGPTIFLVVLLGGAGSAAVVAWVAFNGFFKTVSLLIVAGFALRQWARVRERRRLCVLGHPRGEHEWVWATVSSREDGFGVHTTEQGSCTVPGCEQTTQKFGFYTSGHW
jgi:hypothetical protein